MSLPDRDNLVGNPTTGVFKTALGSLYDYVKSEVLGLAGGNMSGAINEAAVTMASASTMAIGAANANTIAVSGTTTITAFDTVQAGTKRTLRFDLALTVTYNSANLMLPGGANITVASGDVMEFTSFGSGIWVCTGYQPFAGNAPGGYGLGTASYCVSGDANSLLVGGDYSGDGLTNAPTTGWYYYKVIGFYSTDYCYQEAMGLGQNGSTANARYSRVKNAGTWSAWKQLKTTDQCTFNDFKNFVMTVTSNTTATITADYCPYTQAAISLTLSTANSGVNGIDTGSFVASTWYYVFVIYGSSGVACLASTSLGAPTLPSGYTYAVRVGAVLTNASTYLYRTIQRGRKATYIVDGTILTGLPKMAAGSQGNTTTPTFVAVATSSFIPTTAATIGIVVGSTTSYGYSIVAPNANYGTTTSLTNPAPLAGVDGGHPLGFMNLESAYIYVATSANAGVFCYGWEDNL